MELRLRSVVDDSELVAAAQGLTVAILFPRKAFVNADAADQKLCTIIEEKQSEMECILAMLSWNYYDGETCLLAENIYQTDFEPVNNILHGRDADYVISDEWDEKRKTDFMQHFFGSASFPPPIDAIDFRYMMDVVAYRLYKSGRKKCQDLFYMQRGGDTDIPSNYIKQFWGLYEEMFPEDYALLCDWFTYARSSGVSAKTLIDRIEKQYTMVRYEYFPAFLSENLHNNNVAESERDEVYCFINSCQKLTKAATKQLQKVYDENYEPKSIILASHAKRLNPEVVNCFVINIETAYCPFMIQRYLPVCIRQSSNDVRKLVDAWRPMQTKCVEFLKAYPGLGVTQGVQRYEIKVIEAARDAAALLTALWKEDQKTAKTFRMPEHFLHVSVLLDVAKNWFFDHKKSIVKREKTFSTGFQGPRAAAAASSATPPAAPEHSSVMDVDDQGGGGDVGVVAGRGRGGGGVGGSFSEIGGGRDRGGGSSPSGGLGRGRGGGGVGGSSPSGGLGRGRGAPGGAASAGDIRGGASALSSPLRSALQREFQQDRRISQIVGQKRRSSTDAAQHVRLEPRPAAAPAAAAPAAAKTTKYADLKAFISFSFAGDGRAPMTYNGLKTALEGTVYDRNGNLYGSFDKAEYIPICPISELDIVQAAALNVFGMPLCPKITEMNIVYSLDGDDENKDRLAMLYAKIYGSPKHTEQFLKQKVSLYRRVNKDEDHPYDVPAVERYVGDWAPKEKVEGGKSIQRPDEQDSDIPDQSSLGGRRKTRRTRRKKIANKSQAFRWQSGMRPVLDNSPQIATEVVAILNKEQETLSDTIIDEIQRRATLKGSKQMRVSSMLPEVALCIGNEIFYYIITLMTPISKTWYKHFPAPFTLGGTCRLNNLHEMHPIFYKSRRSLDIVTYVFNQLLTENKVKRLYEVSLNELAKNTRMLDITIDGEKKQEPMRKHQLWQSFAFTHYTKCFAALRFIKNTAKRPMPPSFDYGLQQEDLEITRLCKISDEATLGDLMRQGRRYESALSPLMEDAREKAIRFYDEEKKCFAALSKKKESLKLTIEMLAYREKSKNQLKDSAEEMDSYELEDDMDNDDVDSDNDDTAQDAEVHNAGDLTNDDITRDMYWPLKTIT